jgi:predicted aspartyl protease
VDTGNYFTVFDETYSRRLAPLSAMPGDGTSASVEVELRDCPELMIEGRAFSPLLAVAADLRQIQQASGEPLAGILGMSGLKHEVLVFDPDKGQVTFTSVVPENLKKKAVRVHIERKNSSTYGVTAYINGVPVFLALDTGDADCITLNDNDIKRLFNGKPSAVRRDPVAGSDGKIFETQSFRLRTVSVGHNTCTNVIAHTSRSAQSPSRLGQGFIRRYLCAMDFPNRVLYLAPGSRFAAPDEFDMSGLSLLDIGGKVTVYSVEENSPAFEAGVRADDQILSINGKKAASLRLRSIHEMLKAGPGEEITLETKRGGESRPVKFNLRRLL